MNITIFNKKYCIRRFGEARVVKGYITSGYTDAIESLHIHPLSTDSVSMLTEGERKLKRLEGHGNIALKTGDEDTHIKGDLLYYDGEWYETISSQKWDHTLLGHWNYQFVLVSEDSSGTNDLKPPAEEILSQLEGM